MHSFAKIIMYTNAIYFTGTDVRHKKIILYTCHNICICMSSAHLVFQTLDQLCATYTILSHLSLIPTTNIVVDFFPRYVIIIATLSSCPPMAISFPRVFLFIIFLFFLIHGDLGYLGWDLRLGFRCWDFC